MKRSPSGEYKVARPLFIYVKAQHVDVIPGLKDFVAEYVSDKALGEDGYLVAKGLIALPKEDLEASRKVAAELTKLDAHRALNDRDAGGSCGSRQHLEPRTARRTGGMADDAGLYAA